MRIEVAYRAKAKRYKRSKAGKYLVTRKCLFDTRTGKDLILFDNVCPQWVVWKWFRWMNFRRGVPVDFIRSCTPDFTDMVDTRLTRIAIAHERILERRILDDNTND